MKIPSGLVGLANPPGTPDHGLDIPLEEIDGTGINIFAAYNALGRESARQVWEEDEFQDIQNNSISARVVAENAAHLCGRKANQAIVEYSTDSHSSLRKDEVIVALAQPSNRGSRETIGKVYSLHLRSTSDRFKSDQKWFEDVVNSFECFNSK